jgi:hypothetical protein
MTDKQLEEIIESNVDTNPELAGTGYSYSELMSCMKQAIEADRAERLITPELAKKIIAVRDAMIQEDPYEAWHQLYSIACPEFDSTDPWKELEEIALTPTED